MPEFTKHDALELQQHLIDEYDSDELTWGTAKDGRRALLKAPIEVQLSPDKGADPAQLGIRVVMRDPRFAGSDGFEEFPSLDLTYKQLAASPDRIATVSVEMWVWRYEAVSYLLGAAEAGGQPV